MQDSPESTIRIKENLLFNLLVCVNDLDLLKHDLTNDECLDIHRFAIKLQLIIKDSKLI